MTDKQVDRGVGWLATALRVLTTPSCWIRNYKTCKHLSRFINDALDSGGAPVQFSEFRVKLASKTFWAGNFPYAYGLVGSRMPDRATVFRLADAVTKAEWQRSAPSAAITVVEPTREDIAAQVAIDAKREAVAKAKAVGLTDADLAALGLRA